MPILHRALLVDDKPDILRALTRMLERLAIEVITAPSAEAALGLLSKHPFDIVLTDHDMEGENGLWLLEQARRVCPGARRILMSGRSIAEVEAAQRSGIVHAFLEKPATREQLVAAIMPGGTSE